MSAINSNPSATAARGQPANAYNALSSEEFIEIMISELTNQDPLAPNDSKAILEQISSIRAIESDLALQDSLKELVSQNQFAASGTLIGKRVFGVDVDGEPIEGTVRSVSNTRDGILLNFDNGFRMKIDDLVTIFDPAAAEEAPGA